MCTQKHNTVSFNNKLKSFKVARVKDEKDDDGFDVVCVGMLCVMVVVRGND